MRRNVSLSEISDGRLYGEGDMVRADCHGCMGCSACCKGMGNSVICDPYDVWRLTLGLGVTVEGLLEAGKLELNVVDGCVLPNLKMSGQEESCAFLDREGRCSIHESRPGICRLFPLGRFYEENGDFRYFLQTGECLGKNRSKIKISKWIDVPQQGKNHDFICAWHRLLKEVETCVAADDVGERARALNMSLLHIFYLTPYLPGEDFYQQFYERLERFREISGKC